MKKQPKNSEIKERNRINEIERKDNLRQELSVLKEEKERVEKDIECLEIQVHAQRICFVANDKHENLDLYKDLDYKKHELRNLNSKIESLERLTK